MITVDLNCDLGELDGPDGELQDAAILRLITSANVACGGHAGDYPRLLQTARHCRASQVHFGAHPSYPDREHFGRRELTLPAAELYASLTQQLQLAVHAAATAEVPLTHIKPHGALYNVAAQSTALADLLIDVIKTTTPTASLMGLSGSLLLTRAAAAGLSVQHEVFADRHYQANGTLLPRNHPLAVIHSAKDAASRLVDMLQTETVVSHDGHRIPVIPQTVCVHSDTDNAMEMLLEIRNALSAASKRRHSTNGTGTFVSRFVAE